MNWLCSYLAVVLSAADPGGAASSSDPNRSFVDRSRVDGERQATFILKPCLMPIITRPRSPQSRVGVTNRCGMNDQTRCEPRNTSMRHQGTPAPI